MLQYENINDIENIVELDRAHIWHHLTQHAPFFTGLDPRIIVEGKGIFVWDANGKKFLDAVSGGVWTVNVGYGRERIADAVREQLVKMNYFAGSAGSVPGSVFAQMLLDKMPGMNRVFYANSGSEANEKVFKMVRQISHNVHGGKKSKILYRQRDYHGMTIACMSAGGQQERNVQYGPFVPDFVEVPHCLEYRNQHPDAEDYGVAAANAIEDVILREGPDTIGLLCLEPITAGGGVITPPENYWPRVQQICQKYDILLHIDEVVCGLGRTGKWFGYQQYDIQPDFVTMAKGVASGYAAISCLVTTEKVFDLFKSAPDDPLSFFRDISTFGGCTAGPAAAIENMRIIEEEQLLQNTETMGNYCLEQLEALKAKHDIIGDVRGKGLFLGVELVANRRTKTPLDEKQIQAIVAACNKRGVIIGATSRAIPGFNNTLCLSPALIVTKDNIDEIVGTVDEAIGEAAAS